MKLADALSLRKALNVQVANIRSRPVSPQEVTKITSLTAPVGDSILGQISSIRKQTSRSLISKHMYYLQALERLDNVIQAANSTLTASVPQWVFLNEKMVGVSVSSSSLAALLLRRKTLSYILTLLVSMNESCLREAKLERVPVTVGRGATSNPEAQREEWRVTTNSYDAAELANAINFYSEAMRIVDSAVQTLNWSTDVDVSDTIKLMYVPENPIYFQASNSA